MSIKNCCCGGGRICPSHGDSTPDERLSNTLKLPPPNEPKSQMLTEPEYMNFDKWYRFEENGIPKVYGYPVGDIYNPMKHSWEGCKEEVIKIINETPLSYRTSGEHEKLEKFADLIESKIRNL